MVDTHDMAMSPAGEGEKLESPENCYHIQLLNLLDGIRPESLGTVSHTKFVKTTAQTVSVLLEHDFSQLLLVTEAIKDCGKPCYKRDVLLEVLEVLIFSDKNFLINSLRDAFKQPASVALWKELSNCLVALPDLVANCGALTKLSRFKPEEFYTLLLKKLYSAMEMVFGSDVPTIQEEQSCFYIQIIGRIALSGFSELVWKQITSRAIDEKRNSLKRMIVQVLILPLSGQDKTTGQFDLFIEPLYIPIFFYLEPKRGGGGLIKSIIGEQILHQESFKYILCNKSILQKNYTHDRRRRTVILLNIFSYLAALDVDLKGATSLLIKALLDVAESWSNNTKILFRPYQQNRYITEAVVVAFKYALEFDKQNLAKSAEKIQSNIVQGTPTYLNGASCEQRNLAMCLTETLLPKLNEVINPGRDSKDNELKFDVKWDEDCQHIQRLMKLPIEDLLGDYRNDSEEVTRIPSPKAISENVEPVCDDEDDLVPYDTPLDDDSDNECEVGEDISVPIYLRDCITGLSENDKPRYVRICLIKAGELIHKHLEEEAKHDKAMALSKPNQLEHNRHSKLYANDVIRDIAIELVQVLLYLDNQFDIEGFDGYRMKALSLLCVAAPELVVKQQLDVFNGSNKSVRHQLDILQALVASAQHLSSISEQKNEFVRYGSLYFYGIVHKLKVTPGLNIMPTTIVSAAKSLEDSSYNSRESMIRRVMAGLAGTKSKLDSLDNCFTKNTITSSSSVSSSLSQSQSSSSSSKSMPKTCTAGKAEMKGEKMNDKLDDTYLLSRILFSISLIIKCLNKQPIVCKLSNDLLDILAAYRCHQDSGVRKSIVSCLTAVRDCTPSVYFEEYLYDKTMCLFGPWLTDESELINRLRLRDQ